MGMAVEMLLVREVADSSLSTASRSTGSPERTCSTAGTDPSGTRHKVSLVLGRLSTSIQGGSSPAIVDVPTVVEDQPTAAKTAPTVAETPSPRLPHVVDTASDAVPSFGDAGGSFADLPQLGGAVPAAAPAAPGPPMAQLARRPRPFRWKARTPPGSTSPLLATGLLMTAGTRLLAAIGVKAGSAPGGAEAAAPVSVLRLPQR